MPLYDWLYLGMYFSAGMTAYAYKDVIKLCKQGAMIALSLLIFAWAAKEYFISTTILGTYLLLYMSYCTKQIRFSLSKLSFGVYIFSFPIQQLLTHFAGGTMNPYLNVLLAVPMAMLLAWVSDMYFESSIQKLEKYCTVSRFITSGISSMWDKFYATWLKTVDKLTRISWKGYFAVLILTAISSWFLFVNLPSSVDFSKTKNPSDRVLGTGYYAKSEVEDFCFVSNISELHLGQKKGMTELTIDGFIPADFTDVQYVSAYVDNSEYVSNHRVIAGQGFSFVLSIPNNNTFLPKEVSIKLVFNAIHEKEEGNSDVRDLSACILRAALKPSGT